MTLPALLQAGTTCSQLRWLGSVAAAWPPGRFQAPVSFEGADFTRGIAVRRHFLKVDLSPAASAFAIGTIVFGAASASGGAAGQTLSSTALNAEATAQGVLCYNPVDPGQCISSQSVPAGQASASFTAPPSVAFPAGTSNIGTASAAASLFRPGNLTLDNTATLSATASANSLYVSADGSATLDGSFEVTAPNNSPAGQLVPIEVIGSLSTGATGTGWSYSEIEVSGFGANGTFPMIDVQAQTNYPTPNAANEASSYSVDQTIMLEPDTVGLVYLYAETFAGEEPYIFASPTPFALGCPTYCGTASANLDPLIEIAPAFLAANPGYALVFGPGFLPPVSSDVPEPSTWAMMLLGFIGLGVRGWRASRRRIGLAGPRRRSSIAPLQQWPRGSGRTQACCFG
jgi:hypothetical protein